MGQVINLYEAKTNLSQLVERAARGEEIVIAKAGKPRAKLVPYRETKQPRQPANALGLTYIADNFDEPLSEIEALFEDADKDENAV